jgi:serine/threonine protein phosphatase PrpC
MTFMETELAYASDIGRKRSRNEDSVAFYESSSSQIVAEYGRLYIVADGVGGGGAGEVASRYAAEKTLHAYYNSHEQDPEQRLRSAINAANSDLFRYTEQHQEMWRMGTTLVSALLIETKFIIANVGDSRAYLIRGDQIRQITRDHSLVGRLLDKGAISPEQAKNHPQRNIVLRSLGSEPEVRPDFYSGMLQTDDLLVLCTDGLTRHVSDSEIVELVTDRRPNQAVRELVDLANGRGGEDNVSILILAVMRRVRKISPSPGGNLPQKPNIVAMLDRQGS